MRYPHSALVLGKFKFGLVHSAAGVLTSFKAGLVQICPTLPRPSFFQGHLEILLMSSLKGKSFATGRNYEPYGCRPGITLQSGVVAEI